MDRKSLYLALGGIDDDLILEATDTGGQRKIKPIALRLAGIAACLCLLCSAALFMLHRDVIHINEIKAPIAAKEVIPAEKNTTILTLTEQSLADYYGIIFPETLSGLNKVTQTNYYLYQDADNILYDTNVLRYQSADGKQTLSITAAKADPILTTQEKKVKHSRINGVPVLLALSKAQAQPIYWAELCYGDVDLRIIADSMDKAQFVDAIRTLLQAQT